MRYPLDSFAISQPYSQLHPAEDLAAPAGVHIKAPEGGKVVAVNNLASAYYGGLYVVLQGDSGYRHYMGHNSRNYVTVGKRVSEGQGIGEVGTTGFAIPSLGVSAPTGPHVHYEISKSGQTYRPSSLITNQGGDVPEIKVNEGDLTNVYGWLGLGAPDAGARGFLGYSWKEFVTKMLTGNQFQEAQKRLRAGGASDRQIDESIALAHQRIVGSPVKDQAVWDNYRPLLKNNFVEGLLTLLNQLPANPELEELRGKVRRLEDIDLMNERALKALEQIAENTKLKEVK